MKQQFFIKFLLVSAFSFVTASLVLTQRYEIKIPRNPGPQLNLSVRANYTRRLEEFHPEIVLIGDSTLARGVDDQLLAGQTGKSVYRISIHGSASALWYLVLKNNIALSAYKPEYVLVVFRDSILTAPGYRVQGSYFDLTNEYAGANDTLFIERSFLNQMNPLEKAAESYFPPYIARSAIRRNIDGYLRYLVPSLINCDRACTDIALSEMFFAADLQPGILMDAIGSAESLLYTEEQLDFDSQVGESYLPEMIRIARENDIKLVFVRIKVQTGYSGPVLDQYLESLWDYLIKNDVAYLDFGSDPRLGDEYFMDGIHLNREGQILFTKILAEELLKIWKGK